jgi:hypothetical protein
LIAVYGQPVDFAPVNQQKKAAALRAWTACVCQQMMAATPTRMLQLSDQLLLLLLYVSWCRTASKCAAAALPVLQPRGTTAVKPASCGTPAQQHQAATQPLAALHSKQ